MRSAFAWNIIVVKIIVLKVNVFYLFKIGCRTIMITVIILKVKVVLEHCFIWTILEYFN